MNNGAVLISWRKRWNRNLLRFLGSRVRRADIEDIAQETYLRLLRAPNLSDIRNPEAYLISVAAHAAAEWRHRQPAADAIVALEAAALTDISRPDVEMEANLSQRRIDEILQTFSPTMRAVLLLKLRDDRGYKEIAEDLGLSLRQVKRVLARGYDALRQALE